MFGLLFSFLFSTEAAERQPATAGEAQHAAGESRPAERHVWRGESPEPPGGAQYRYEEERAASQPTSSEESLAAGT